jgi:hypothetical protein
MDALASLDRRIAAGAAALPPAFCAACRNAVLAHRLPDGGFRGRAGAADEWYTDFALRVLALTGADTAVWAAARDWLAARTDPPADAVAACNRAQILRLLAAQGFSTPCAIGALAAAAQREADGHAGLSRAFLAAVALGILGRGGATARTEGMVRAAAQPDGGFADAPGGTSQANATAAALAWLAWHRRLDAATAARAAAHLVAQQREDGGLSVLPELPCGDLLATANAVWVLAACGRLDALRLDRLSAFVRACRRPDGSFGAVPGDQGGDPEYVWYGLNTLGLLSAHAGRRGSPPAPARRRPLAMLLLAAGPTRRLGWWWLSRRTGAARCVRDPRR